MLVKREMDGKNGQVQESASHVRMEAGLDKKDTLEDVNRKVEALRASGRLETMLKRIGIDANGHFVEGRKHAW